MSKENGKQLRVCIDARFNDKSYGGCVQAVIGLAGGLSSLRDGNEQYLFLANPGWDGWLKPYIDGPCQVVHSVIRDQLWRHRNGFSAVLKAGRAAKRFARFIRPKRPSELSSCVIIKPSDGTVENLNVDVMHFTSPMAFETAIPSIYQPWDLQHVHFPQFFSQDTLTIRELTYRTFCEQAAMVAVASQWTKQDLIKQYQLPPNKIEVVPAAPVVTYYPIPSGPDLASTRNKYVLPERFIFYPAQTWEHKNHIAVLDALAILRDRYGLTIDFVSSGRMNEHFRNIEERVRKLGLGPQVRFLGFVTELELQCLYKLCRCLVFPSKFEGFGMPVVEALYLGVPIACSSSTSLPEIVGDAAILFDSDKPEEIACAIHRLWSDDELCRELIERGKQQVIRFNWDTSARLFRAHYRRIANRGLTDEDRILLGANGC